MSDQPQELGPDFLDADWGDATESENENDQDLKTTAATLPAATITDSQQIHHDLTPSKNDDFSSTVSLLPRLMDDEDPLIPLCEESDTEENVDWWNVPDNVDAVRAWVADLPRTKDTEGISSEFMRRTEETSGGSSLYWVSMAEMKQLTTTFHLDQYIAVISRTALEAKPCDNFKGHWASGRVPVVLYVSGRHWVVGFNLHSHPQMKTFLQNLDLPNTNMCQEAVALRYHLGAARTWVPENRDKGDCGPDAWRLAVCILRQIHSSPASPQVHAGGLDEEQHSLDASRKSTQDALDLADSKRCTLKRQETSSLARADPESEDAPKVTQESFGRYAAETLQTKSRSRSRPSPQVRSRPRPSSCFPTHADSPKERLRSRSSSRPCTGTNRRLPATFQHAPGSVQLRPRVAVVVHQQAPSSATPRPTNAVTDPTRPPPRPPRSHQDARSALPVRTRIEETQTRVIGAPPELQPRGDRVLHITAPKSLPVSPLTTSQRSVLPSGDWTRYIFVVADCSGHHDTTVKKSKGPRVSIVGKDQSGVCGFISFEADGKWCRDCIYGAVLDLTLPKSARTRTVAPRRPPPVKNMLAGDDLLVTENLYEYIVNTVSNRGKPVATVVYLGNAAVMPDCLPHSMLNLPMLPYGEAFSSIPDAFEGSWVGCLAGIVVDEREHDQVNDLRKTIRLREQGTREEVEIMLWGNHAAMAFDPDEVYLFRRLEATCVAEDKRNGATVLRTVPRQINCWPRASLQQCR